MSALPPPSYEESQRQDEVAAGKDPNIAMMVSSFFIDLQDIQNPETRGHFSPEPTPMMQSFGKVPVTTICPHCRGHVILLCLTKYLYI